MPARDRVQWATFRVIATAAVALLILAVVLALLTGGTLFQQRDTLRVFMPDAAGLGQKAPVRLNGIPIGTIKAVRLSRSADPNRQVEVTFDVDRRHLKQLAADSVATTTTENIQGDKFLDITRGKSSTPLRSGAELRYQAAPDVMKTLDLVQFEQRLRAIDDLLAEIQNGEGSLGELLRKDDIYKDTVAKVAELQNAMHAAVSTRTTLGQLLNTDTAYQNIVEPVRRVDQALERLERGETAAGQLLTSDAQYGDLLKRIRDMRRQLADLNAGRGAAGRLLKRDDMYQDWTRRLDRMIASVDSLNAGEGAVGQMLTGAETYESLNGSLRELQHDLADLRGNPQKYLRLKIF